jgi:hypothetical protein
MGPATPPLGAPASPNLSGAGIYHMPPPTPPTLMNNPTNPIPSTINAGNPSLSVPNTSGGLGSIAPRPRSTMGMGGGGNVARAFD